jgi:hypothetical protein
VTVRPAPRRVGPSRPTAPPPMAPSLRAGTSRPRQAREEHVTGEPCADGRHAKAHRGAVRGSANRERRRQFTSSIATSRSGSAVRAEPEVH